MTCLLTDLLRRFTAVDVLGFNGPCPGQRQMLELLALHVSITQHKLHPDHQSLLCNAFSFSDWTHLCSSNSLAFICERRHSPHFTQQTKPSRNTGLAEAGRFLWGGNRNRFDAFTSGGRENFSQACQEQFACSLWAKQPLCCLKDQTSYCSSNEPGNISGLLATWPSWSQSQLQQPPKQLLLSTRYK